MLKSEAERRAELLEEQQGRAHQDRRPDGCPARQPLKRITQKTMGIHHAHSTQARPRLPWGVGKQTAITPVRFRLHGADRRRCAGPPWPCKV